jgi:quinol-cytochrome oxidoreductase complex cytochrome b subunit
MSFWGATVITNLFGAIPFVGKAVATWLWGGYSIGDPTINRFFSLHYLFPFLIAGVVILHIWALHVPGNGNPAGINSKGKQDMVPFHPYYTSKDAFGLVLFLIMFAYFVFFAPNSLGDVENYVVANPLKTPLHIVPEWYLLPFYAILRAVPSKIGGVILMFGAIAVLFVLPWLDTSKVRSARFRPLYKQFFWLHLLVCLVLGWCGAQMPDNILFSVGSIDITVTYLARVLAFYYFFHFIILFPLLGLIERPKPLPESISASVLKS